MTSLRVSFVLAALAISCAPPRLDDAVGGAASGIDHAFAAPKGWWKVHFADDFRGPEPGVDPSCYTRPPLCNGEYVDSPGPSPCPPEVAAALADLNKCAWTVYDQKNWMDDHAVPVNTLDPREVRVERNRDGGVLVLSAHGRAPSDPAKASALPDAVTARDIPKYYDCSWNQGKDCPIVSGAVYSQSHLSDRGFDQRYGRFEVRAKLPHGQGAFPAAWMLPEAGPWPEAGEIDIMEADKTGTKVFQTFHTGGCEKGLSGGYAPSLDPNDCWAAGGARSHLAQQAIIDDPSFASAYHTYAVEWEPTELRWFVDDQLTHTLHEGDSAFGSSSDSGASLGDLRPMSIPSMDFFQILNLTIKLDGNELLNPLTFSAQELLIDSVVTYDPCVTAADFCPAGGDLDVTTGTCGGPNGRYASACTFKPHLPKTHMSSCTMPCPYGGYYNGSTCRFFDGPPGARPFAWGDSLYIQPMIANAASDPAKACPVGSYDGANCWLGRSPSGMRPIIKGSSIHYAPACSTGQGPEAPGSATPDRSILGYVDGIDDLGGSALVRGWSCAANVPQSVAVHLYAGGPAGSGTFVTAAVADQPSEVAVSEACNLVGAGAFRFAVTIDASTLAQFGGQSVWVHGISPVGGTNDLLANSGVFALPLAR